LDSNICYFIISFYICSGSGNKTDEAIGLYINAANMFKMAKKWGNAGEAFVKAADLHQKAGSRHDTATYMIEAANCYKKTDTKGKSKFY